VDTGEYAIAPSTAEAARQMHKRRPEGRLFLRRIGSTPGYVVSRVGAGMVLAWQECHDRSDYRLSVLPPGRTRRPTRNQPHRNQEMPLQGLQEDFHSTALLPEPAPRNPSGHRASPGGETRPTRHRPLLQGQFPDHTQGRRGRAKKHAPLQESLILPKQDAVEMDELCISQKRNLWLWTAVSRYTGQILGYVIGM
jgi:hypothetical protein